MVKMVVLSGASERADGSSEAVSTLCRTPHPAKANQLRTAAGSQPRRCGKKIVTSADVFGEKEARYELYSQLLERHRCVLTFSFYLG